MAPSASTTRCAAPENVPEPIWAVSVASSDPVKSPSVLVITPATMVAVAPNNVMVPLTVAVQSSSSVTEIEAVSSNPDIAKVPEASRLTEPASSRVTVAVPAKLAEPSVAVSVTCSSPVMVPSSFVMVPVVTEAFAPSRLNVPVTEAVQLSASV